MPRHHHPESRKPLRRLAEYLAEQARTLERSLPKITKHVQPKPVHQARVAARRLSAAVGLLGPIVRKRHLKRAKRLAKQVRHALGDLRDAHAMAETLDRFHPSARVRKSFDAAFEAHRKDAARRAKRKLDRCGKRFGRDLIKSMISEVTADAVAACVRDTAYAALDEIGQAVLNAASRESKGLHPTRIATKRLRYALEIGVAMELGNSATLVRRIATLQDQLGAWHDATVLARFLLERSTNGNGLETDSAIAAVQARLADRVAAAADRAGRAFTQQWRTGGDALAGAIRAALPLAGGERQTIANGSRSARLKAKSTSGH